MSTEAKTVGVKVIEVYFPSRRVQQRGPQNDRLAMRDSKAGDSYVFCDDREDEKSMALTVLASLFRSRPQAVHPGSIGRLELAITSADPASRSLGSLLKPFFHPAGNTSIVGVQSVPGCEGGQDAILNTVNWIHSSEWDGRDGLVVLGSVQQAEKEEGVALAAVLIGPHAPVVLDECPRALCFRHPCERFHHDSSSTSPSSDENFLSCLAQCYRQIQSQDMIQQEQGATERPDRRNRALTLDRFQRVLFQCPSLRLTRKAYAYLLYLDFLANPDHAHFDSMDTTTQAIAQGRGFVDDEVQDTFYALSDARYEERIRPSLAFLNICGYAHAATLWASLASVLASGMPDDQQPGPSRVLLFAYGDGVMSAMYTATMSTDAPGIIDSDSFRERLEEGTVVPQETFDCVNKSAAQGGIKPSGNIEAIGRDTYYLHRINADGEREYRLKKN
ncbi:hypothetical protein BO82DRAFT_358748 [Aspergillus uvarum CBS 121591]|uniref:Hydroxymethylglutaryl-CoA synthase n=1 Tax=Aspergillus uvarum CBS 121591 TaxID=1448315 RepID=A0A319BZI3_9EURO|nr:hypothetical protein BO82DRAFT_358748 [Aspergillus uvarum CBS 121591]PYH76900.1 hypothetical protein BO82DRAFT_358748 [Aspergillus uvarum CBS 121591]